MRLQKRRDSAVDIDDWLDADVSSLKTETSKGPQVMQAASEANSGGMKMQKGDSNIASKFGQSGDESKLGLEGARAQFHASSNSSASSKPHPRTQIRPIVTTVPERASASKATTASTLDPE